MLSTFSKNARADTRPFGKMDSRRETVNSGLDYTIVRPAGLTNLNEIDYETTKKDQPFRGTEVSRKSVAAYIYSLFEDPNKDILSLIDQAKEDQ
ncbi:MAG: SDR family oxidoreductase [Lactobacillus crispatus]|jgi:uncharacterized protein YbjT (DUF2867 family)|nr:SDR family oxidoreductase [Lactobacillus crispatus]MCI1335602.1 SDR family oxidoreductase [Lactobacillus crispatus]MCI1364795.1 SDR family oxidoreductase [Lactobacillus crispatus]MCI1493062.1 SDR family oxidoreductase [Lactobacillus crispatus]MCI1524069.1 SDR family oxidoreductase [Lactobacillus crispatus]